MPDRRIVDDLSIEELEQILIVKRRETRAERMRRLQEIGRLPAEAAIPHEDLAPVGRAYVTDAQADNLGIARQRPYDLEPLGGKKRSKAPRQRAPHTRWGRLRDGLLLALEVGALLGLVAILVASILNLKSLNDEYAQASLLPTATPTPLAGGILPGEHRPPEEPGSVPVHLRDLIEGEAPPAITIPTPGPEAPTRIVIPAIKVDALVVQGDSWEQLKLGVGHHLGSANPGERGNMVLSAHDDIYGEIFRRLHELELGDEVIIYAGEQPYRYRVTAKQIVEPTEVRVLASTTKPVATLITCYPYMVDTHRVIVVAELQ
ncbi:MAG: class D sortase [Anaerolineae bacterium]|nr:class D sortase [Anaerolineae bacterium]